MLLAGAGTLAPVLPHRVESSVHREAPAAASAPAAPEEWPVQVPLPSCGPEPGAPGAWQAVADLAWEDAQTSWPAVADVVLPERGASFSRNPLVIAGTSYDTGLGTYPLSEVTYALDGRYQAFHAVAGLNDDSSPQALVVFQVYADGALVYTSGPVGLGAAVPVDLCMAGVQRLRLVTAPAGQRVPWVEDRPPDQLAAFADWADARLFRPPGGAGAAAQDAAEAARAGLDGYTAARRDQVIGEMGVYQQQGAALQQTVAAALGQDPAQPAAWPAEAQAAREQSDASGAGADGGVLLAHRRLALRLSLAPAGGAAPESPEAADHARLSVLVPGSDGQGALTVTGAGSTVQTTAGPVSLTADTVLSGPDAVAFSRVDDPALGGGTQASVSLRLRDPATGKALADGPGIVLQLTLYDDQALFTYRVVLDGWPGQQSGAGNPGGAGASTGPAQRAGAATRLDYLSTAAGDVVLGDTAGYFADAAYVRSGALVDDGLWRQERIGLGKPAVLWGDAVPGSPTQGGAGSIVMATLDEQRLPAWLVLRRDPAHAAGTAGVVQPLPTAALTGRPADQGGQSGHVDGPRLLVQVAATQDLRAALDTYRQVTAALYPPAPLPDWLRYQWGSWWVYGSAINADQLRNEIDLIASQLRDLGPWHILIDAGWEDVGPDGSDEMGQDNRTRFPQGLRAVVDYAHSRGIKVILFFSAVYVHDGNDKGEWLGVPRLIGDHPDWFIRLTPEGVVPARYLFDYSNPGARDYLVSVLHRYVADYDADGVKIDGLGDVEGQLIPLGQRVQIFPQRWALTPVMDVYRTVAQSLRDVKPDAFVESGWVNPAMAQPYAQTFRSGDEWNVFDHQYPFPGLAQHFTYAAIQQGLLGQRANIGAIYGGLEKPLAHQWLGAALAIGAQVSLGSEMGFLSPEQMGALRAWLAPQRPFAGITRTGPQQHGLAPEWAATTYGDVTYLALLNATTSPRQIRVSLADAGVPGGGAATLAFDPETEQATLMGADVAVTVPPQTVTTLVLRQSAGPVWSTSSVEALPAQRGWKLALRGPEDVPGELRFYAPGLSASGPSSVLLDGKPLQAPSPVQAARGESPGEFSYDGATGLLTAHYGRAGLGTDPAAPARVLEIVP